MKVFLLFLLLVSPMTLAKVNLVFVDKSERKMVLYENDKAVRSYHIALGGSPEGHKQQEGDQRTPEGTYVLDYINEQSSYYRSMHVSYPNEADKQKAKELGVSPGGFIMVHGQPNGLGWMHPVRQAMDWTDGCIAITNEEMDEFLELVEVGTKIRIEW